MARRGRKRKMAMAEDSWEKDKILPENLRDEMETMWELPQIFHFLQLTKEAFNVTHLSMYEVERMLLMPKASKQLAHIMTCLLSNPSTTKSKLHKVPLMPYTFWTNVLMYKLKNWFKIHQSKRENPLKTFDCLGVEPEFWKIFPDSNEIEGKDFQDFSFKQRVWLLKTVCDTAMHTRKTIQEEITRQPSENQFETVLGTDRYGARYVYFPQFLHNDLRVYRHCLDNKVLSSVKPPAIKVKPKSPELVVKKDVPRPIASRGRRKRRRSRWQKGSLPLKVQKKPVKMKISCGPLVDQGVVDSSSNSADTGRTSRCSSKASELSASSCAKSSGYETNALDDVVDSKSEKGTSNTKDASEVENDNVKVEGKVSLRNEETKTEDGIDESLEDKPLDRSINDVPKSEESSVKESSNFSIDDVSKSSKTDDEKLEEMIASKTLEKSEPDNKKCDTPTDVASECASDELSLDKWMKEKLKEKRECKPDDTASDSEEVQISYSRRSARIKHISEIKLEVEDAENIVDMCETEELSSIDLRDSLCRVSSPEGDFYNEEFNENDWNVKNFNELISDLSVSNFQLVADSLDSLKELIEYIASDKTTPNYESKETYVTLVCEVNLLQRMKKLAASLEKVESILKESTKKARNKLQREWSNFENGVAEEDQEQQQDGCDEGMSTNGWLVGPQGCNFEQLLSAEKCSEMLSQPALSRDGTEIDSVNTSDPSSETPSSRQADQAGETQDETAATKKQDLEGTIKEEYRQEANGEEGEKDRDAQDKGRDEEEEREKTEEREY
ncbi:uncharacterized protein LOC106638489 isoform X2 [Copidosoma floridanum]|uniref:uncharacterized protein LOC106638489 isoform X2 n=1 Tax=Copidosoma floridanum TaxID=29053 RepID=UPI0006C995CF|nr:uncharacterized protein LOC106638489 isoform X2 [Copidosoma floridanum]